MPEQDRAAQSETPPNVSGRKSGWRGKRKRRSENVQHKWQADGTQRSAHRLQAHEQGYGFRLAMLMALFAALFGAFFYYLLFSPVQTPFIAITATSYEWPFTPNAWAREDLDGFLDKEYGLNGETLSVVDCSKAWQSREQGLRDFDRQLNTLASQGSKTETVIIYISMHGAVDGNGNPCLVPPSSSPRKSETWLPLDTLLERIKSHRLPGRWKKLLILDTGRIISNWNMGVLYNGFADRLAAVVREADVPNLVVLNSTSPGQVGWASSDLEGSVFGHYLLLGLAGAADRETGNADEQVSLLELHRYLLSHVDGWVAHNRADRQQPMLVPAHPDDFNLAWSLGERALERLSSRAISESHSPPLVAGSEIAGLWEKVEKFSALDPIRLDPLPWQKLKQQLLWLEMSSAGGRAYAGSARRTRDELTARFEKIEAESLKASEQHSVQSRWNLFSDRVKQLPDSIPAHSMRMAEYFGSLDAKTVAEVESAVSLFSTSPNERTLYKILESFSSERGLPQLSDIHFLRTLQKQQILPLLGQPAIIGRSIDVRRKAEALAVPEDERLVQWIHSSMNTADNNRRKAEDVLFVGNNNARQLWAVADQSYEEADHLSRSVAQALQMRDLIWAEIPALAQWATLRRCPQCNSQLDDGVINETLLGLIERNHLLGNTIAQGPNRRDGHKQTALSLVELSDDLQVRHEQLRRLFDKSYERLLEMKGRNGASLSEMAALLSVSLLPRRNQKLGLSPAQQRANLQVAYERTSARLHSEWVRANNEGDGPLQDAEQVSDSQRQGYLERISTAWDEHPAVAILNRDYIEKTVDAEESDSQTDTDMRKRNPLGLISEKGERVRLMLDTIGTQVQMYREETAAETDVRLNLSKGERLVRAASAFTFRPSDDDPIARLRRVDLKQVLLWHCRRSLDDFWGPISAADVSFFEVAAVDYLKGASTILEPGAVFQQQRGRLQKLLTRRRNAAGRGLQTRAGDILLVDGLENATTRVVVKSGADKFDRGFPEGTASVFLRDEKGRLQQAPEALKLPLVSDRDTAERALVLKYKLKKAVLANRGPLMNATTLYRGHEFVAPFVLGSAGGISVDYAPYVYKDSKITLRGNVRKRPSVVFILDCSRSMTEEMQVESVPGKVSRLDVAKSALTRMLDRLAEQGNARVGVLFYGHRVGWNTKQPDQLLRQVDYSGDIPESLLPFEDVEMVLNLGRFDGTWAEQVSERMQSVRPWGETPLYLAIVKALSLFSNEDGETQNSIVVITDGMNYQFNPTEGTAKNVDDVIAAWKQRQVPIHIVGFGIPNEQLQKAQKEFGRLTAQVKGSYVPVFKATSLIKKLENLLRAEVYRLRDQRGHELQAEIGSTLLMRPIPKTPRVYRLSVNSAQEQIEIAGGEALELSLSRDGRKIESVRYDKDFPKFGRLTGASEASATGFRVGVHRPIRKENTVEFTLSIQHEQRRFTRRPAEVWIEITPQLSNGRAASAPYVFYDANYEPGTPVPVLKWHATNWPGDATGAAVRFWCKPQKTEPSKSVRLSEFTDQRILSDSELSAQRLKNVSWQVTTKLDDGYRINVVERHPSNVDDVVTLKVEAATDPRPSRIIHRFDKKNRVVTHTFFYNKNDAEKVRAGTLHFSTRRAIRTEAWRLDEPIIVDIAESSGVIRVVPVPK